MNNWTKDAQHLSLKSSQTIAHIPREGHPKHKCSQIINAIPYQGSNVPMEGGNFTSIDHLQKDCRSLNDTNSFMCIVYSVTEVETSLDSVMLLLVLLANTWAGELNMASEAHCQKWVLVLSRTDSLHHFGPPALWLNTAQLRMLLHSVWKYLSRPTNWATNLMYK